MREADRNAHRWFLATLAMVGSLFALFNGNPFLWLVLGVFVLGAFSESTGMRIFSAIIAGYSALCGLLLLMANLSPAGRFLDFLFLGTAAYALYIVLTPVRAQTRVVPVTFRPPSVSQVLRQTATGVARPVPATQPSALQSTPLVARVSAPVAGTDPLRRSAPLPLTVSRDESPSIAGPLLLGLTLTALTGFAVPQWWYFLVLGAIILLALVRGCGASMQVWLLGVTLSNFGVVAFAERALLAPIFAPIFGRIGGMALAPVLLLLYAALLQLGTLWNGAANGQGKHA